MALACCELHGETPSSASSPGALSTWASFVRHQGSNMPPHKDAVQGASRVDMHDMLQLSEEEGSVVACRLLMFHGICMTCCSCLKRGLCICSQAADVPWPRQGGGALL